MPSLVKVSNAGREARVTTDDHGQILFLGNASDGRAGTFVVQFVPDGSFQGGFSVVARVYGKPASDAGVGFSPIPYRRVVLSGVASDRALVADPLTTQFLIEVPANGIVVGLLASVQQGFGTLYSWPLNGPAT